MKIKKNKHLLFYKIFLIVLPFIVIAIILYFNNNSSLNQKTINNENPNINVNPEYRNMDESTNKIISYEKEKINDQFSNTEELHWIHMPLTYNTNFSTYSQENKKSEELNVKYALERIHNAVPYITFIKTEKENPDILFVGQISLEILSETENFVGLAMPNYNGKIIDDCLIYISEFLKNDPDFISSYPTDDEVHEIIHCFGIDHTNVLGGMMYPSASSFPKKIEEDIISCLKSIYSNNQDDGNCSKIKFYKSCEKGYTLYSNNECYKSCPSGYVLGEDLECHENCNNGYYCLDGTFCRDDGCYGCEDGYYLGEDNLCYPKGALGNLKFFFHSGQSPTLLSDYSAKSILQMHS